MSNAGLHQGWQALSQFSLAEALLGRRSRRFGVGMSIPEGPLAFTSRSAPQPLSEEERSLLIALGAGVSGWNFGIPYSGATGASGCHYGVRPVGRTYPSGAAVHGTELLITDDSGTYITSLRDFDAHAHQEHGAPSAPESLLHATKLVSQHVHRLTEQRVDLPSEYPHVGSHNQWTANHPGSTLFVPIADQAETLLNLLWIYTGEGAPIKLNPEGRYLGAPKQLLAQGLLQPERSVTLAEVESVAVKHTTIELALMAYNLQLGLQALGLGGWLFTGLHAGSLLGAYHAQGIKGFGFRCAQTRTGEEAFPLGLDRWFEPLVPPYVRDMGEATQRFLARKFGANGNYEPTRPGPFRDNPAVKGAIARPSSAALDYLESLTRDIFETFGRFPATVPAVNANVFTQAHHIDLEFYDAHYGPGSYLDSHVQHQDLWHASVEHEPKGEHDLSKG